MVSFECKVDTEEGAEGCDLRLFFNRGAQNATYSKLNPHDIQ